MSKFAYSILILVGLAMAMWSCDTGSHDPSPEPTRLLLVYVGVDNNLSPYYQTKLEGLRDGWSGRSTDRIFAYVDVRGKGAALYELSAQWTTTPFLIENFGVEDSADPETLSRVINDVLTQYPADSYGLLVFSHASGWLPQGVYSTVSKGVIPEALGGETSGLVGANTRSVIYDGDSEMDLKDLAIAIPDGVFDYIVFEACFMAGIEVAYELRHKAPYILGSSAEIVNPGFAPVYSKSTNKLLGGNVAGFAQDAFGRVMTYADNGSRSSTLSVVRTAGLDALAAFVRENCDLSREIEITDVQHFDRNSYRLFFDFEDYYSRLLDTDAKRAELARLVAGCIVWKDATDDFFNTGDPADRGFTITQHSGLTTYIPQTIFAGLNEAYEMTGWAKACRKE